MQLRLLIAALFVSIISHAQFTNRTDFDIQSVDRADFQKRCGGTQARLNSLPPEIHFSAHLQDDSVFLTFPSAKYFWQFFESKNDGFAIDLVHQGQYQCDNIQRLSSTFSHKGFLLEPVYRDEIKKRLHKRGTHLFVFAGKAPKNFDPSQVEANFMILEDRRQCYYNFFVNFHDASWSLLSTGLYYDSLQKDKYNERYKDLSKALRFTIPFEKNKSVYKKEDIKPLYDSLKLTDYEITSISIKSFTSVEGTLERNLELQEERARSIVGALQEFQPEHIRSDIVSNENWVEFNESVVSTPYARFAQLSKQDVKEALKDKAAADDLEPLLSKHRKAIIELTLEKRVQYSKSTAEQLKKFFSQSIDKKDLDEAIYLQEIIFQKIKREQLPPDFLRQLDVPESKEYGSLLMNQAAFEYETNILSLIQALSRFEQLNKLVGGNAHIEYNICALKLTAMKKGGKELAGELSEQITSLRKKGISNILVLRLMVNYHLLNSELMYHQGNHEQQRRSVQFILDSYKKIKLTDEDLVSLAKYLSYNAQQTSAIRILEPRIKALDASEELLFYYVNLTMIDKKRTSRADYRTLLLNSVNSNRDRFCKLFEPIQKGGVSFQLLSDEFLKKTYCENCK